MRICDWSSDVCSSDLGMIFRKPPLVEHPEAMGGFMEDVTLAGVSFQSFAEMSVDEVVTVGRAGVLVDFPRVETGGFTLARSEDGRVGKACVSTCSYRVAQYHKNTKQEG